MSAKKIFSKKCETNLFSAGSGSRPFQKSNPVSDKNRPDLQHCFNYIDIEYKVWSSVAGSFEDGDLGATRRPAANTSPLPYNNR
jgi:hypothetical protein